MGVHRGYYKNLYWSSRAGTTANGGFTPGSLSNVTENLRYLGVGLSYGSHSARNFGVTLGAASRSSASLQT
jgi:hypothetical protein